MKKKYAMTLLEIMIVIFIIGIISSVIGYNMRGSLDKGRAFKTKEGINKLYEIVQLEEAGGTILPRGGSISTADVINLLQESHLVRKPKDLVKDGWGNEYIFEYDNGDFRAISSRYENYCEANNIQDKYPWDDQN